MSLFVTALVCDKLQITYLNETRPSPSIVYDRWQLSKMAVSVVQWSKSRFGITGRKRGKTTRQGDSLHGTTETAVLDTCHLAKGTGVTSNVPGLLFKWTIVVCSNYVSNWHRWLAVPSGGLAIGQWIRFNLFRAQIWMYMYIYFVTDDFTMFSVHLANIWESLINVTISLVPFFLVCWTFSLFDENAHCSIYPYIIFWFLSVIEVFIHVFGYIVRAIPNASLVRWFAVRFVNVERKHVSI
jgi:hypothetical protein